MKCSGGCGKEMPEPDTKIFFGFETFCYCTACLEKRNEEWDKELSTKPIPKLIHEIFTGKKDEV